MYSLVLDGPLPDQCSAPDESNLHWVQHLACVHAWCSIASATIRRAVTFDTFPCCQCDFL